VAGSGGRSCPARWPDPVADPALPCLLPGPAWWPDPVAGPALPRATPAIRRPRSPARAPRSAGRAPRAACLGAPMAIEAKRSVSRCFRYVFRGPRCGPRRRAHGPCSSLTILIFFRLRIVSRETLTAVRDDWFCDHKPCPSDIFSCKIWVRGGFWPAVRGFVITNAIWVPWAP
jgi:hypothetical protein